MAFFAHYRRSHGWIVGFTVAYLLAAGVAAAVRGNQEFIFYLAVMLVLVGLVAGIDRRVRFSIGLLWCLTAWGAMHMAGGLVPVPAGWPIHGEYRVLYSWWVLPLSDGPDGQVATGLKYDQITHAWGFGVTCWACWQGLVATMRGRRGDSAAEHGRAEPAGGEAGQVAPTFGRLFLCFAAALGFGALNEVVEFIATTLGPTNVGGYVNTGYDLIFNTVGAAIAAVCIRLTHRRPESEP